MDAATMPTMPTMGFYRNMNETESHLAADWTSEALCGARPQMHGFGWMFGADNTIFSGITEVCPDCQQANREIAASLGR